MGAETDTKIRKIVCIEDEEPMSQLLIFILKSHGYEGFAAMDGPEGLELIRSEKPDLVLLDLMLPGMDGWEVFQKMKSDVSMRTIPVIVVTCKSQPIDRILAKNIAKVDDYVSKPFSPSKLAESIEKVLSMSEKAFPQQIPVI